MKKTGEILKKSREEKQLSIHEIGLSLKINSKILKAIEEGDVDSLPAKTFLRGFVQSYAQYLKLNSDEVLKLFTSEMGTTKPHSLPLHIGTEKQPPMTVNISTTTPMETSSPPKESAPPPATEPKPVKISSGKQFRNMTLIASVIVLVTLILITKKVIDRYQNEAVTSEPEAVTTAPSAPPAPAPAVETQVSATAPAAGESTAISSQTAAASAPAEEANLENPSHPVESATPFVNSATTGPAPKSAVAPNPALPMTVANPRPAPTPPPVSPITPKPAEAKPVNEHQNAAATTPAPKESPKPLPAVAANETQPETPVAEKPAVKNIELIIEALDTVDVEYSTATGKSEKLHLEPEQLHTIKTRAGLKLNVSNGGAVSIIVNGKEIGIPGVLGKPIKLTY